MTVVRAGLVLLIVLAVLALPILAMSADLPASQDKDWFIRSILPLFEEQFRVCQCLTYGFENLLTWSDEANRRQYWMVTVVIGWHARDYQFVSANQETLRIISISVEREWPDDKSAAGY